MCLLRLAGERAEQAPLARVVEECEANKKKSPMEEDSVPPADAPAAPAPSSPNALTVEDMKIVITSNVSLFSRAPCTVHRPQWSTPSAEDTYVIEKNPHCLQVIPHPEYRPAEPLVFTRCLTPLSPTAPYHQRKGEVSCASFTVRRAITYCHAHSTEHTRSHVAST